MPMHKGGKKSRKHGKGDRKLSHSRWGTYAVLIGHQLKRRGASLLRRFCLDCNTQVHSRGSFNRHDCN